jgi:hypothetical protein
MSNQQAAGPTLAEGTIVERKGDDIRDRQSPEVIHFKGHRGAYEVQRREDEKRADTTVTVDDPNDDKFLVVTKDGEPAPAESRPLSQSEELLQLRGLHRAS